MLRGHLPPPEPLLAFVDAQLGELPGRHSDTIRDLRRTAADAFLRAGLPGARAEAWKYTPLPQLLPKTFSRAVRRRDAEDDAVLARLAGLPAGPRIVFVDGRFAPGLSDFASAVNGVSVRPLAAVLDEAPDAAAEWLGPLDPDHSLGALNAALLEDGCIVDIPAGATGSKLVLVSVITARRDEPTLINTRNIVRLAEGAEATLSEVDLLLADVPDVLNRVVRLELAEGARLVREHAQIGGSVAQVLEHLDVSLAADSRLTHSVAVVGGALMRHEVDAALVGSGIEATFNGLSLIGSGQHVDHALTIRHRAPSSVSDQFYKGVLDGRARSAFAGKIVVDRAAQKTNAYQSNNNLLLSADAEANAKPELEIYADDVKCSHGATAGELDERELFYLRSRGLDTASARALLTFAFAGEVLERFQEPGLAGLVRREVLRRLGTDLDVEGMVQ